MAPAALKPFSDEPEYLEAQLERLRRLIERALAVTAGKDDEATRLAAEAAKMGKSIAARAQATLAAGTALGLESLRRRFQLDDEEADLLLHAAVSTLDGELGKLHTRLSGMPFHPWLDVGLAIKVHHDTAGDRLRARTRFAPEAPLLAHRLITLDRARPEAQSSLLACELKLPSRVARLILGTDPTGGGLGAARLVTPERGLDEVILPEETRAEIDQLLAAQPRLAARLSEWGYASPERAVTVLLAGPPGTGKTTLAHAIAKALGRRLLVVDGPRLLDAGRGLEAELDELWMEARLADAVVLFDGCEAIFSRGQARLPALYRALDRAGGLVLLATHLPDRLDGGLDRRVLLRVQLEVPAPALREKIWRRLLHARVPLASDVDVGALAKRYDFSGGHIRSAALYAASKAVARGAASLAMADLDAAAQAQLRGDLTAYAERTRAAALSLDVLILPPDVKSQIEEIIAAGKNRGQVLYGWGFSEKLPTGKGLVVLLSGDPGTGKTLAAEVIAAELGLHLYRVNPAKVVSKFVGETEKNLNEILAQAKATHAVLFFDEADALFSTRVAKVETANDRFVNMETNFLLQQLERYEGIVILATNLETSIDPAFKRRIAYHVTVPFPTAADRERIWRTLIPARAPVGAVDYARLGASFELSGGHIKNAILRAAYTAAQKGANIDHQLLSDAAEHECAAAGKLFQTR